MPVTVEPIDNEPIILATFRGFVDLPTVQDMFRQSAAYKESLGVPLYRITDVTQIETSLKDLLEIVNAASQDVPGSPLDPDIRGMFVGTNKWVGLFQSTISGADFGSISIPAFTNREDALAYIQRQRDLDDHGE